MSVSHFLLHGSRKFFTLIIILLHCETTKTLFESGNRMNSTGIGSMLRKRNILFNLASP